MKSNNISVGKAAKRLGVSVKTLQRYDEGGKLKALRTACNRRYYTESQIQEFALSRGSNANLGLKDRFSNTTSFRLDNIEGYLKLTIQTLSAEFMVWLGAEELLQLSEVINHAE